MLCLKNLRLHHHQQLKKLHWLGNTTKMRFQRAGRIMSEKLSISKSSKDTLDKFAKGFCFSMVHIRISKCISNATITENYQKTIEQ